MELVQRLDDYGKPAWITIMVLGFVVFWPIGLAILAYLIWSGRMGCWKPGGGAGRWHHERHRDESKRGRKRRARCGGNYWRGDSAGGGHGGPTEPTGNNAFDEYREETLRRLEEEEQAFQDFLARLRQAKDKREFDQFMADRANWSDQTDAAEEPDLPDAGPPSDPNGTPPAPEGPVTRT